MSIIMGLFIAALVVTGLSVMFYNAIEMEEKTAKAKSLAKEPGFWKVFKS